MSGVLSKSELEYSEPDDRPFYGHCFVLVIKCSPLTLRCGSIHDSFHLITGNEVLRRQVTAWFPIGANTYFSTTRDQQQEIQKLSPVIQLPGPATNLGDYTLGGRRGAGVFSRNRLGLPITIIISGLTPPPPQGLLTSFRGPRSEEVLVLRFCPQRRLILRLIR